jgi:hypothetical protein
VGIEETRKTGIMEEDGEGWKKKRRKSGMVEGWSGARAEC